MDDGINREFQIVDSRLLRCRAPAVSAEYPQVPAYWGLGGRCAEMSRNGWVPSSKAANGPALELRPTGPLGSIYSVSTDVVSRQSGSD